MIGTFSLSEKLYLLTLNPEKGGTYTTLRTAMEYVLPGCFLLEMVESGNIKLEEGRVVVVNSITTNPVHQFLFEKLGAAGNARIQRWILRIRSSQGKYKKLLQKQLVNRHFIRLEDRSFLFFRWKKPFLVQKEIQFQLSNEIYNALFGTNENNSSSHLLSMVFSTEILRKIYPEREKSKRVYEKLKEIKPDNPVSVAVRRAIDSAKAAAVAAST